MDESDEISGPHGDYSEEEWRAIAKDTRLNSHQRDLPLFHPGHRCFTAVGNSLPCSDAFEVGLERKWQTGKYEMQFFVESFQEILPSTAEGIENYLE